jgi:hypothetical protein
MTKTPKSLTNLFLGGFTLAVVVGIGAVTLLQSLTSDSITRLENQLVAIYSDVGTIKYDMGVLTEKASGIDQKVAVIRSSTKGIRTYIVNREAKDYSQGRLLELVRELPKGMEIVLVPKIAEKLGAKPVDLSKYGAKYKFISPWKGAKLYHNLGITPVAPTTPVKPKTLEAPATPGITRTLGPPSTGTGPKTLEK